MKRVTASDARKNWFRLLDEVVAGETVVIERNGHRVLLQRDTVEETEEIPDYSGLLRGGDIDRADSWGWRWDPDSEDRLRLRDDEPAAEESQAER